MEEPTRVKFRAWIKKAKKMVPVNDLTFNPSESEPVGVNDCGDENCPMCIDWYEWNQVEIMQYTGLKDKTHLKEIVFGDVVIVDSPKGPFKAKITQEVGAFGIVAIEGQIIDYFEDNFNDDYMALLDIYWNFNNDDNVIEQIEVIGNIYENPELLETKKD